VDEYSAQPKTWRSRNFFGKILFTFCLLSLRSDFHSEILFYQFSQQLQLRAPLPVLTYTDYPVPGLPPTIPRILFMDFTNLVLLFIIMFTNVLISRYLQFLLSKIQALVPVISIMSSILIRMLSQNPRFHNSQPEILNSRNAVLYYPRYSSLSTS